MEGGNLVIVDISGDVSLRGVAARYHTEIAPLNTATLQPLGVGRKVCTHRRQRQRLAAQQLQVIGDVAGAAPKFLTQLGHQEGDVQDVDLIRQNVITKAVSE